MDVSKVAGREARTITRACSRPVRHADSSAVDGRGCRGRALWLVGVLRWRGEVRIGLVRGGGGQGMV